jgi:hypothetical protein
LSSSPGQANPFIASQPENPLAGVLLGIFRALLNHKETEKHKGAHSLPINHQPSTINNEMNANAIITTSNLRDFRNARESLGLQAIAPAQLVTQLALEGS